MIEFLMKKVLLIGLAVLFFTGVFLMLRAAKERDGELRVTGGSFIEGIRILQKKNGVVLWDLTAGRADFESENRARLSDVSISLRKNGVVLFADRGVYNLSDKSFTTDKAIKAEGDDYRITADSADFEIASGNIKTEGNVKMEGKGFEVEGRGLKAEDEKKVKIFNDVKATFHK
jgi:hypothetical protein